MKIKCLATILLLFFSYIGVSQTFSAKVLDATTKEPIESASVYFDNTTLGTTTNSKGIFSIAYTNAIQSSLVISCLGFQTETILDYRQTSQTTIYLKASLDVLGEVLINTNDGLTRRQKLRLFRTQFLGFSSFSKSCKILNEDDLVLRYNKKQKQLTASAIAPLIIQNKGLQYEISFDIEMFEINFNYVEEKNNVFNIKSVRYSGRNFYKNLDNFNEKKALKNRMKAYDGSVLQFMRMLYNQALEPNGYQIFFKGFIVNPWEYFKIQPIENSTLKQVTLNKPVSILYDKDYQSMVTFLDNVIVIDVYGNYSDVTKVMFSGYMSNQRVGDLLPLDFGLGK